MTFQTAPDFSNLNGLASVSEGSRPSGYGLTEEGLCKTQTESQPVFAAFIIALVVLGLFGNLLVFFTIMVLQEYKKSVTNWYILQLTLADTLFLLMLPFTAHSEITGAWKFSVSLCKFKEAVLFINYYASIYFLVIMSFDRYLAVTKALASSTWATTLRSPIASYIISIIGWIVSVLLCIQLFQYSKINHCGICGYLFPIENTQRLQIPDCVKENSTACSFDIVKRVEQDIKELNESEVYYGSDIDYGDFSSEQLYALYKSYINDLSGGDVTVPTSNQSNNSFNNDSFFSGLQHDNVCRGPNSRTYLIWIYGNFLGAFILPFVLICFFYGMIMNTITRGGSVGDNARQRAYRRRVTMIVIALVTLFVVSWLPWFVEKLIKINGISLSSSNCNTLSNAVRGIAYLSSALNPYFYSFLGFHFRERLKEATSRVAFRSSMRSKTKRDVNNGRRRNTSSNSIVTNHHQQQQNHIVLSNPLAGYNRDHSGSGKNDRQAEKILL